MTAHHHSTRPLSPHMSIWRWGVWAITSGFHRATGIILSTVGLLLLTWWLVATAAGPEEYAFFYSVVSSIPGQIVLFGVTWSYFQHFASGFRHLIMDTGIGYGSKASSRSGMATFIFSAIMTLSLWGYLLFFKS